MSDTLRALLDARQIRYESGVPMATRTTLKVGGPADFLVDARSEAEAAEALRAARVAGPDVLVIGNGSNLLVRDGGVRGLVLVIGDVMASIERHETCLDVQAGASLARIAQAAQAAGLTGLEALSGIPGTLGGSLCMNAGAYGVELGALIESVDALDGDGNAVRLKRNDLQFGYRRSALKARGLIATRATLALTDGDPVTIAAAMRDYAARRRDKQPLTLPSAGSFFKRPEGAFAGQLIEQAGLKGASVGGAKVSELHAGFLVNAGGATANDFLDLMALVRTRVHEMSGIWLEPEVQIVGCDSFC